MGFPPNSDQAIHQAVATSILSFEMVAPHGARIFATQSGCRIDFVPEHREHLYAWLRSELQRLETFGSKQEELVECPECHSKIKMVNNLPVFCTVCKGMGRVTKSAAAVYAAAHPIEPTSEIVPTIPTELRPPSFAPIAGDFPVPSTKVLVGKVQPDTDDGDFVAPLPGQEGFIGPLQQHQR